MEALADKICKEELNQEPNENNLTFRKTLVHGMVRWQEETEVKKLNKSVVIKSVCCGSQLVGFNKKYDKCFWCGKIEKKRKQQTVL